MKRLIWIMAIAATLMAAVSCGQKKQAPKVLVLYYSQTNNTRTVAEAIAGKLGADTEEIVALNPYDGDFQATIGRCMQEREAGIIPEIEPVKADLASYDIIFLGYPIWFGTFAPPMGAFVKSADLAGKKVKYSVTLKAMRKLTPADDAAVLARFGKKDMAELTASITDNLKLGKRYSEEQRATNDLIEAIDKSVKFDLPERVVEERTYDMLAMDPAKPLEQFKEDAAALRKSDAYKAAVDRASKTVRREYTLLALAAERKITLSADEVEGALTRLAQAHNMKKPDLIRRLQKHLKESLVQHLAAY